VWQPYSLCVHIPHVLYLNTYSVAISLNNTMKNLFWFAVLLLTVLWTWITLFTIKYYGVVKNFCDINVFLWPPCVADADIIFSSCAFFFLSFIFFSSPNLSGRILDVYYTSTLGVALVQIRMQVWNMLFAARWKYRMQKSRQKLPPGHHCRTLSGYIFATYRQSEKKLVKQQYLLHISPQYGELRPTSGWDCLVSLGHPR